MEAKRLPKETLEDLYLSQGKSQREIGEEFGVALRTIGKWLQFYGIQARPRGCPHGCNAGNRKVIIMREDVERMYVSEQKTQKQIAEHYGVSDWAIGKRLQNWGIESRPRNYYRDEPLANFTKADLERLYVQEKQSMKAIAKTFGTCSITIAKWLRRYGLPVEMPWERNRIELDAEELKRLYFDQGLTLRALAERFDCSLWTIRWNFRRNGIDFRNSFERRDKARYVKKTRNPHREYETEIRVHADGSEESVLAHRAAAERAMGRELSAGEIVHHINMVKTCNLVGNLAVLPSSEIHHRIHKYMERVCVYLLGYEGSNRPEPIQFEKPVFWAGQWITTLDLMQRVDAPAGPAQEILVAAMVPCHSY